MSHHSNFAIRETKFGDRKLSNSLSKRKIGGSRFSVQSNEIVVVEEVNDNEISSEAFKRIRETSNIMVNSLHTDDNSKTMGPLLDDDKLP